MRVAEIARQCSGMEFRRTPGGHPFVWLPYTADPEMIPSRVKVLRSRFTSQADWDIEMEGIADAKSGVRVFPEWKDSLHVIDDARIPLRGVIYMALDPHPRTPHAMLWMLVDRWEDWYVFREFWPSKIYGVQRKLRDDEQDTAADIKDYAEAIAAHEGNRLDWQRKGTSLEYASYVHGAGERICARFMDQAGKAFRASGEAELLETYANRYARFGIQCQDPIKRVELGYDAIRAALKPRAVDEAFVQAHQLRTPEWPRLHVARSCIETRLEFRSLRYQTHRNPAVEGKEVRQGVSEYRRHLIDNLRYIVMSSPGYSPTMETQRHEDKS